MSNADTIITMLNEGRINAAQADKLLARVNGTTTALTTRTRASSRQTVTATAKTTRVPNPDASNAYSQVMALDAPYGTKKSIAGFAARLVAESGKSVQDALTEAQALIDAISGQEDPKDAMRFFFALRQANVFNALTTS